MLIQYPLTEDELNQHLQNPDTNHLVVSILWLAQTLNAPKPFPAGNLPGEDPEEMIERLKKEGKDFTVTRYGPNANKEKG